MGVQALKKNSLKSVARGGGGAQKILKKWHDVIEFYGRPLLIGCILFMHLVKLSIGANNIIYSVILCVCIK